MKFYVPDHQDQRPNDRQLYLLVGTALRLGYEPVEEPAGADFWLIQIPEVAADGAHASVARDGIGELLANEAPYGTTPAFLFAPTTEGYVWGHHNVYKPGYLIGPEEGEDEDLSEAFHDFAGEVSTRRSPE